jgi:uncharacterized protein YigE (DUF2233 family)
MRALLLTIVLAATALSRAAALDFETVVYGGKRFTVCRVVISKDRLQIYHRDERGVPIRRLERLKTWLDARQQKLLFAMNGGMYHGNFAPVGLLVCDSWEMNPLNAMRGAGNFFLKPNGVFAVTEKGAQVVETSEYARLRERVILATQSGPMLVRHGVIHPAFRPESESRLIRNGVGVPSPGIAIFVISEDPVNFHQFASLFRDRLHCPDALFLDGTVSSLYSAKLNRCDFRMDLGPMIAVTE